MKTNRRILAYSVLLLVFIVTGIPESKTALAAGPKIDQHTDIQTLEAHCTERNARACAILGWKYKLGRGVPKNLSTAAGYYEQACNLELNQGCFYFAELIIKTEGRRVEGLGVFEKLCNKSNMPGACEYAGLIYERGVDDIPANAEKSKAYFALAAKYSKSSSHQSSKEVSAQKVPGLIASCEKEKDHTACDKLGTIYKSGNKEINADAKKSEAFFMRACRLAYFPSCYKIEPDIMQGFRRIVGLCESENLSNACVFVASIYKKGSDGVSANRTIANKYFDKACELGHDRSCLESLMK